MKNIIALVIGAFGGVFFLNSCSEPYNETIELEQFMYLSLSGAADNPVVKAVEVDQNTTFPITLSYGGTTNYNQGEYVAQIAVDNSLVAKYNSEKSTTYLTLPAGSFSLDKTSMTIADGSRISDPVNVTIKAPQINFENEYLLPVTIQSVTEGKVPLNEEFRTIYYIIKGKEYDWEKSTWEVIAYRSQWGADWGIHKIFDGNKNTTWHSDPFNAAINGMPQWFVVDMKKIRPIIRGFLIWQRQDDHGMEPKHVVFSVSEDNVTWKKVLEVTNMSNDYTKELDYRTTDPAPGRYLKVEILATWGANPWTYFGEITPY